MFFSYHRIQQIQLLGRDMRGSEHDQLWNQIEAEIHLHRHKTVIRACRGRKDPNNKAPAPPPPEPQALEDEDDSDSKARKRRGIGEPRTVVIQKSKTEGLGISITVRGFSFCFIYEYVESFPTLLLSKLSFWPLCSQDKILLLILIILPLTALYFVLNSQHKWVGHQERFVDSV